MVATRDPKTGKTEFRKVIRTFSHLAHETITAQFADAKTGQVVETLTATPEHPFFVAGQGFASLGSLGVGTLVVTRAGPPLVVKSLARQHSEPGVLVYNLEVEDDHTYFVGNHNDGIWVHNNCIADAIANGHAFIKHVLDLGEFQGLGIRTVKQFSDHIADVMQSGTVRSLARGRTAYWDNASGTVVIHDPASPDLGTAFQPTSGVNYFHGLH